MIGAHQPTIFGKDVLAGISSKKDGNMKFGILDDQTTVRNRQSFLGNVGITLEQTTLVSMTYTTPDFAKYRIVTAEDKSMGMMSPETGEYADALVVTEPNHALFLPLADCVGAILYDPVHHVLMVSHLGRHNIEQDGARKSVQYLLEQFGTTPSHLKVWLSPGVGKDSYPLHAYDGRSLHDVITDHLIESGVARDAIENGVIDTATHEDYYSHSEYLKKNETEPGRFAIVAMMTMQGEPAS